MCIFLIPLQAMGRAATAFSRLADTTGEELPSTMAAIRLFSLEISGLTLELSELSQEASDGIIKSAQAVKQQKWEFVKLVHLLVNVLSQ
ncbi:hypothetical protein Dimus_026662 [Dionaea muscipula]